jgi:hypothetical protein
LLLLGFGKCVILKDFLKRKNLFKNILLLLQ